VLVLVLLPVSSAGWIVTLPAAQRLCSPPPHAVRAALPKLPGCLHPHDSWQLQRLLSSL